MKRISRTYIVVKSSHMSCHVFGIDEETGGKIARAAALIPEQTRCLHRMS